jgi:HAE1 family hydrophobic/amphiphilic exporter-1
MHIIISAEKLAAYKLTTNDVITAIQSENINVSAGTLGVGRRDFRIRTTGEFNTPEDIAQVVLRSTGQQRVRLGDLAEIRPGFEKKNSVVLQNGVPGIAIGVRPEAGTNILEMTNLTEEKYLWLNENKLNQQGLYLDWVYDQRFYINGAIDQIKQNIIFGGLLAIGVLLLFLRSLRATIVVAFYVVCVPPLLSLRRFQSVSSAPSSSSTCSAETLTWSRWQGLLLLSACWSTTPSSSSRISTVTD